MRLVSLHWKNSEVYDALFTFAARCSARRVRARGNEFWDNLCNWVLTSTRGVYTEFSVCLIRYQSVRVHHDFYLGLPLSGSLSIVNHVGFPKGSRFVHKQIQTIYL